MSAKLGGIAPGFGSKREMAPEIISHFGPHDQFWEPFVFTCSILLAKEPCRHEIVSEKNPDVANLIRVLADSHQSKRLWEMVSRWPVSESLFDDAVARLSSQTWNAAIPFADRAFDFLLVSWQGPSGLAGTTRKPRFAVRNTTSGGTVAARWRSVADSIPEWHERLRNVEFRCKDAFELIAACPDREGTVNYCDPPYLSDTRTAGHYLCDFTPEDHVRLAESLSRFKKTKVLLSYYDSPRLAELYPGWHKVTVSAPRKMKHVGGGDQETVAAPEVLLINRV